MVSFTNRHPHRSAFRLLLVAPLLTAGGCASAGHTARPAAPAGYELVWSDEFDHDGRPDPHNWTYERGFVRNHEAQWYQPENARVEDGRLIIEARRERLRNPRYDSTSTDWRRSREYADYTSASLTTRGLHAWRYGRFEMRARIPVSPGMWPAFWTVGEHGRWPASGEIDIMEYYRDMLLANVAWAGADGKAEWDDTRRPLAQLGDSAWASRFHVWRMDWDEKEIRLYVDDSLLNTTALDSTFNADGSGGNPLRQAHHVILNLAIGGDNGGDPGATHFPARYEIDYVRVYRRVPAGAP
ncbi:MAG TPA: glycoside hydrolase family 16 protein [Longimicrobiaceae bacterium]|nr:glycoside hydrolase family 16 protein [Longimicrobiaceae bacterium]